ncbi:dTDP-4-dehydrorhamnose reductase [Agrobacterium vitis]|uniref:dTDP-4-dehydrorhamnose reductase n=1 Tax=Agrobacterium vitis TaxID=373 RepID=A0ABD6GHQ3_AGRVI|nr:dTDP-4-dehydrorhamnose reductase [Agrobacterium vitis]MUO81149.1 dTDP-4-dehydrorhamnose reductase [Agrobacterium vitis]MUO95693.1 dTDP-4-dehydrorhamnose reductase [Agrobacterium vitis]MUP06830.1 dTDP-4-dehydrorhamnose reductase [Agrobacterium vitis]MUZ84610.1 dTDP-4-dehydrorhamnose reductase [Agrobacterium vitis]MVA10519.1 dTDP-4-dehydrorhamnose reductase [Agrobacterium vitis]
MSGVKRYLVTGLAGQVVQSLLEKASDRKDIDLVALGRPQLDLADPSTIDAAVRAAQPDLIISAAAYTAVDQAETDEAAAFTVNGEGPGELARVAKALDIPIIHISTDYVFDGSKASPYNEADPVAPLGVYGRSKLEGERRVAAETDNHAILRTAWVYSPFGKNFLLTMLRLAETRDELGVVADQIGNPTSALDIADAVLKVAENLLSSKDADLRGTFHMTGSGEASWAEFAAEIFRLSADQNGPSAKVNPIPASAYPTPAKRPANSRLDCAKLARVHAIDIPDWRVSTQLVIDRLRRPAAV